MNLYPAADALVYQFLSTRNFGKSRFLATQAGRILSRNFGIRAYLRFDLSPLTGATIQDATLNLYCFLKDVDDRWNRACFCSTDSWSESGVTWKNQPLTSNEYNSPLDSKYINSIGWYSWNVKDKVIAELGGDKTLTLVLRQDEEDLPREQTGVTTQLVKTWGDKNLTFRTSGVAWALFYSREWGRRIPYLRVYYSRV